MLDLTSAMAARSIRDAALVPRITGTAVAVLAEMADLAVTALTAPAQA